MKNFAKVSIIISLIFSILACSIFSSQTNKSSEITLTDEKPIVVLDTGNSDYPRIALFKGGEVLVPFAKTDANGQVTDISGVVFIAPDGKTITFYFENGLPVRAIAEDHLIQFENFTGSTVDITVIAPDGTISKTEQVPFDMNQISPLGKQGGIHLASMAEKPNNTDINWLSMASTAVGVFSCAATVATVGTLAVTFGVGCGLFVYETYLKIVEKETPVAVKGTGMVVSGVGCARGIIAKEPLGLVECASLVLNVVEVAVKHSQETEQKLITMVGADPNTRQELVTETQIEPNSQSSPNISYEDFASIVDNLWLPSGAVTSECEDYGNGNAFCKVDIDGGDWKTQVGSECHESGYWYFYLYSSENEASAEECTSSFCNEDWFSGAPSGEFSKDITTGHTPIESEPHLIVNVYYQNGPIVATGGLFSCGADEVFPESWNLQASDAIAFITPVRNWLHDLSNK